MEDSYDYAIIDSNQSGELKKMVEKWFVTKEKCFVILSKNKRKIIERRFWFGFCRFFYLNGCDSWGGQTLFLRLCLH
jgi:hypothetical protein